MPRGTKYWLLYEVMPVVVSTECCACCAHLAQVSATGEVVQYLSWLLPCHAALFSLLFKKKKGVCMDSVQLQPWTLAAEATDRGLHSCYCHPTSTEGSFQQLFARPLDSAMTGATARTLLRCRPLLACANATSQSYLPLLRKRALAGGGGSWNDAMDLIFRSSPKKKTSMPAIAPASGTGENHSAKTCTGTRHRHRRRRLSADSAGCGQHSRLVQISHSCCHLLLS